MLGLQMGGASKSSSEVKGHVFGIVQVLNVVMVWRPTE